eukprot:COSAG02_NODE_74694_length_155_cov_22.410714_1_plen_34_part_01
MGGGATPGVAVSARGEAVVSFWFSRGSTTFNAVA